MIEYFAKIPIMFFFFSIVITITLINIYIKISKLFKIIDKPTAFNLHQRNITTGAGIVFLFVFLISIAILHIIEYYKIIEINYLNRFYIFTFVIIFLSIMSFYDDIKNIHPNIRFFFQIFLVSISLPLVNFDFLTILFPFKLIIIFSIFFWVYIINITNFIDGLDGFLTCYSIFFFINNIIFFNLFDDSNILYFLSLIFFPMCTAFLFYNRSPAKVFMGDSGSIFLGYYFGLCSLFYISINRLDIMISLLCYPVIDCSLTIIKKMINGSYPWERLFDYYFLKPVKLYNKKHNYVLAFFIVYLILLTFNLFMQIYFDLKYFCILSIIFSLILIKIYNKKLTIDYKK